MRRFLALLLFLSIVDYWVGSGQDLFRLADEEQILAEARTARTALEAVQQLRGEMDSRAGERLDAALAVLGNAGAIRAERQAGRYDAVASRLGMRMETLAGAIMTEPALAHTALLELPLVTEAASRAVREDTADLLRGFLPLDRHAIPASLQPGRLADALETLLQRLSAAAASERVENAAWAVVGEAWLLQDKLSALLRDDIEKRRRAALFRFAADVLVGASASLLLLLSWYRARRAARGLPAP